MPHYTYYVRADFWGKYCRGNLVKITISNRFGKLVVVNSDSDPKYSGEVKMILSGQELRMDLLNGEGCYIVSNERHCPQDSTAEIYKKLTDAQQLCHGPCL